MRFTCEFSDCQSFSFHGVHHKYDDCPSMLVTQSRYVIDHGDDVEESHRLYQRAIMRQNEIDSKADGEKEHVETNHFRILQPPTETTHPVPWRLAERRGTEQVVVNANGDWVCNAPNVQTAQLIVEAVHEYARNLGHVFEDES